MDLAYSDTWAPYNPFHGGSGMCIYKSLGVCAYSLDMCGFLCVAMSDLACRRTHTHHCPSVSHCWESSAMCTHVCTCICICCLILSHDRELYACPKNSTVPFVANSFGMCTNVCVCVCICVFLWWYICVSVYIYTHVYVYPSLSLKWTRRPLAYQTALSPPLSICSPISLCWSVLSILSYQISSVLKMSLSPLPSFLLQVTLPLPPTLVFFLCVADKKYFTDTVLVSNIQRTVLDPGKRHIVGLSITDHICIGCTWCTMYETHK